MANGSDPLPAEMVQRHVLLSIPTFGMMSKEFFTSILMMGRPMNTTIEYLFPEDPEKPERTWLPIDEARNRTVERALEGKFEYILFRDDDVIDFYPNTLIELMGRNVDIIGGVYCVKAMPPDPLIFGFGKNLPKSFGGYRDWTKGDVFKVDAIGMGLTLIRTEIFNHIPKPWFKTTYQNEPDDEIGKLATSFTEDIYFCLKAKEHGFDTWVDTGIQAYHQDFKNRRFYHFDSKRGLYGYLDQATGTFWWNETAQEIEAKKKKNIVKRAKGSPKVRFDLGAGWKRDGYITVDMEGDCDEKGDFRNLEWLTEKYGLADEVRSSHALEHIPFPQAPNVLRQWLKALKPGGKLEVGVPDLKWCVENWLKASEDDPEKYQFKLAQIFGLQTSPGHEHKGGFTVKQLEVLCQQLPFENVKIDWEYDEKKSNQPTIWIRGTKQKSKKAAPKPKAVRKDPKIYLAGTKSGNNGTNKTQGEKVVKKVLALKGATNV